MALTTFVGVDLAWSIEKKTSAIAVLRGDQSGAELAAVSGPVRGSSRIVEYIVEHSADDSAVAIDASLVVRNATGQRPCEKLIGQQFGAFGASCHSTNLAKRDARTGMLLVGDLERHGFRHDLDLVNAKGRPGRWLFEVYPHPAMVRLWALQRIIRYKRGRVPEKRVGLRILQRHLRHLTEAPFGLIASALLLELLNRDVEPLRGQTLKDYEDSLDAVFCAYLAWHCWRWGEEGNEMFGTLENGYIVVPRGGALPQTGRNEPEMIE